MYYYIDKNGAQQGPIAKDQLLSIGVKPDTLVWKAGMEQWTKANLVPELHPMFIGGTTCPPPRPPVPPTGQSANAYESQGYNKDENATGISNTYLGGGIDGGGKPAKPNNNLILAIISTVMCCIPLGAVGIYYAYQSDLAYNAGDYTKAESNGKSARNWSIASIVSGFVFIVIYMICMAIGAMASVM